MSQGEARIGLFYILISIGLIAVTIVVHSVTVSRALENSSSLSFPFRQWVRTTSG